jgi:hypothetical protein
MTNDEKPFRRWSFVLRRRLFVQCVMKHTYRYYDLIMALFVAVLLTSNIASSAKIVAWGVALPVLGLPLAFDAGTLLFPIS